MARAFLRRLPAQRKRFGRVILADRDPGLLRDPFLNPAALDAEFRRFRLRVPEETSRYRRLLREERIGIVLDVTTHDTIPLLAETDAAGVSYLNTCLCDGRRSVGELVTALFPAPPELRGAPHILCAGMNPGAVNLWVHHGIERHGRPREVVHFEIDSSEPADGWRPVLTWSREEYVAETSTNPTGVVRDGRIVPLLPNALAHREDLRPILRPLLDLDEYPRGFVVLHEENVTLGRRLGLSSRFVYAIHARTMEHLLKIRRSGRRVRASDLVLGDNVKIPLKGADFIGVCLEYGDRRVYYANRMENDAVTGTNATCAQVAAGLWSALLTLLVDRLDRKVHFIGDLVGSAYRHLLFDNLRVEESVFDRRGRGWTLRSRVPALRADRAPGTPRLLF